MLGPGDRRRDLQQKGRLADAGIAAQQQHGATHQPAAGHAIKFGYARGCPRSILRLAFERLDSKYAAFLGCPRWRNRAFLDKRVPLAASLAAAGPAHVGSAAVLTDVILCARRHFKTG